jgi:hypothetical protein
MRVMWRGSFRAPNLAAGGRVLRNVLCDVAPPVADEPVEHMPYTVVEICLTSLTTMSSGSAASPYLLVPTAFSCFVFCFVVALSRFQVPSSSWQCSDWCTIAMASLGYRSAHHSAFASSCLLLGGTSKFYQVWGMLG